MSLPNHFAIDEARKFSKILVAYARRTELLIAKYEWLTNRLIAATLIGPSLVIIIDVLLYSLIKGARWNQYIWAIDLIAVSLLTLWVMTWKAFGFYRERDAYLKALVDGLDRLKHSVQIASQLVDQVKLDAETDAKINLAIGKADLAIRRAHRWTYQSKLD